MSFDTIMALALGLWACIVIGLFFLCGWLVWGAKKKQTRVTVNVTGTKAQMASRDLDDPVLNARMSRVYGTSWVGVKANLSQADRASANLKAVASRPTRAAPSPAPAPTSDSSHDFVNAALIGSMFASSPSPAPAPEPCRASSFSSGGGGDYGGGGASGSWDSGSSSSSSYDSGSSSSSSDSGSSSSSSD